MKLGKVYDVESLGGVGRGSGVSLTKTIMYIDKLFKEQIIKKQNRKLSKTKLLLPGSAGSHKGAGKANFAIELSGPRVGVEFCRQTR